MRNIRVIENLVEVFNGHKTVKLRDIITKDFSYVTDLGTDFDYEQSIEKIGRLKFDCFTSVKKISTEDFINYIVSIELQVLNASENYNKSIPGSMVIVMEAHKIKSVKISYVADLSDMDIMKKIKDSALKMFED